MSAINVLCAQLTRDLFAIAKFLLPRDAMHSADYAVARSLRLSVTRRYYVETAKRIVSFFSPLRSHTTLSFSILNVMAIFRRGNLLTGAYK